MKQYEVVIVGATGLVGQTLLSILLQRSFPIKQLHLLASAFSAGKIFSLHGKQYLLEDLTQFDFSQTEIAFFCVGNELAAHYIPIATQAGNVVIDKSHFFRNHREVPLIVPEVNLHALNYFKKRNIVASPNCTTIPIAMALKPIYDRCGLRRINIATYQSISGAGKEAVRELKEQTKQVLERNIDPLMQNGKSLNQTKQIAFNVLPQIDAFEENGYTREEMKMVWELHKIFNDRAIAINPTAVRVPVFCGHAVALHIETHDKLTAVEAKSLLTHAPGIRLMDNDANYPTPVEHAAGQDAIFVGRIREDISYSKGLNLWIVADNLRKGAALNAIQIAENLLSQGYV